MMSGFIEKVLPIKRKGVKLAGPAVEKLMKIPMPEMQVFDDVEYMMEKMEHLQQLMINKEVVSLRIVTTPEKIVIKEAKRNFTCLYLYNYNVDAIIVNRIYPQKAIEGYFSKWTIMQSEGLKEISESFSEVPCFYLELQKGELRTLPLLKEISKEFYGQCDPASVLFQKEIYTIEKGEEETRLKILLPFADKKELNLRQDGNELILSFKNETRRFPLSVEFNHLEISGAKFEDGYLIITFDSGSSLSL